MFVSAADTLMTEFTFLKLGVVDILNHTWILKYFLAAMFSTRKILKSFIQKQLVANIEGGWRCWSFREKIIKLKALEE